MQKILLIGKNGQLGWELQSICPALGQVTSIDSPEIDLAQIDDVRGLIRSVKPTIIINAAAYTNVDRAESELELAHKVNALAPAMMAEEAKKLNAAFIHYSTDYVFDGNKGSAYFEADKPNPINVYGRTKLEGEELIRSVGGAYLILRTSWVYSNRQGGFVAKVLQWSREQEVLRIVDDQIGSPTWARMLAEATVKVISHSGDDPGNFLKEHAGLYHLAGGGSCSRYEWAEEILKLDPRKDEQKVKELLPAKTSEFPTPAVRPMNTGLDCRKIYGDLNIDVPDWKSSIREMFQLSTL